MKLTSASVFCFYLMLLMSACKNANNGKENVMNTITPVKEGTFAYDKQFLQKFYKPIVLKTDDSSAQVLVCGELQGRVMTSTAEGDEGGSFGWINYDFISSQKKDPHFNPYGGEDRLWMGPEGGQFSIFFKKGDPFDLDHWFVPPAIDTEPFELVSSDDKVAKFKRNILFKNYSGTELSIIAGREVSLLSLVDIKRSLGILPGESVKTVAYQSENKIMNTGKSPWDKSSGLLSIWILGMYNASPATTVVLPYVAGDESKLGPVVNDTYFGKVSPERMKVDASVIYFKGDGKSRSKIGLSPSRAKSVLGSYDKDKKVLTIVQYNKPEKPESYVNSMWEIQKDPFSGDVVNSYNDGPQSPGGKQMGNFYELESSSPALPLKPLETILHIHRTFHFKGSAEDLNKIATAVLGVGLDQISSALPLP